MVKLPCFHIKQSEQSKSTHNTCYLDEACVSSTSSEKVEHTGLQPHEPCRGIDMLNEKKSQILET